MSTRKYQPGRPADLKKEINREGEAGRKGGRDRQAGMKAEKGNRKRMKIGKERKLRTGQRDRREVYIKGYEKRQKE